MKGYHSPSQNSFNITILYHQVAALTQSILLVEMLKSFEKRNFQRKKIVKKNRQAFEIFRSIHFQHRIFKMNSMHPSLHSQLTFFKLFTKQQTQLTIFV